MLFELKNKFVVLFMTIVLILGILEIYKICQASLHTKETSPDSKVFVIETPVERYNHLMSSIRGLPFELQCSDNKVVNIVLQSGYLFDDNDVLKKDSAGTYSTFCGNTIYWNTNEIDESNIKITFGLDDEVKSYTIIRDENYDYFLENK